MSNRNVMVTGQDLSELDYVERKMFPDGNGTAVNFSDNAVNVEFNFELDAAWEQENCKLVFFLQDNTSKEIVQGDQIDLQDLPMQTDITNVTPVTEVSVYPNPFTEVINITGDDIDEIKITDITGRRVFFTTKTLQSVNTQDWATGIYFVKTMHEDQQSTVKVMKK